MTPPLPIDELTPGATATPSAFLCNDGHNHMGGEPSAAIASSSPAPALPSSTPSAGKDDKEEDKKCDNVEDKTENSAPEPRDEAAGGRTAGTFTSRFWSTQGFRLHPNEVRSLPEGMHMRVGAARSSCARLSPLAHRIGVVFFFACPLQPFPA
jgi:hypothetical protein